MVGDEQHPGVGAAGAASATARRVTSLPAPVVRPGPDDAAEDAADRRPLALRLAGGGLFRLWVFDFGLACCAVECVAAASQHDPARVGVRSLDTPPPECDVLVVSGTVTDKVAPAVRRLYDQMPGPRHVISFGACSNSGGPYWDSYAVTKGVDQVVPVDVYVPGCPPRPQALLQGVEQLRRSLVQGAGGQVSR